MPTPCVTIRLPPPMKRAIKQLTTTDVSKFIREAILEQIKNEDPELYIELTKERQK